MPALGTRELVSVIVRFVAGLVIVLLVAGLLGYWARQPTQQLARLFVDRFGVAGMALGTFLADGLHFPVPPQFYMFTAIVSGESRATTLVAITFASLTAGFAGYALAARASRASWLASRLQRPRALLAGAFERYGYWAALVSSLLPLPYSVLCNLAGLNRLPRRFVALLALCRVPKLLGFYYLIRLGWGDP